MVIGFRLFEGAIHLLIEKSLHLRRMVSLALGVICWLDRISVTVLAQPEPATDEVVRFQVVDEEMVCVSAKLLNEKVLLLVDTGSSITMLESWFQDRLSKRIDGKKVDAGCSLLLSFASNNGFQMRSGFRSCRN